VLWIQEKKKKIGGEIEYYDNAVCFILIEQRVDKAPKNSCWGGKETRGRSIERDKKRVIIKKAGLIRSTRRNQWRQTGGSIFNR
jgi:hypothetical protein